MFYALLEAFSVHFATLPWLAWSLLAYLGDGSRRRLVIFFLVAILSTPQFFVPTLLIPVGVLLVSLALFSQGLTPPRWGETFKRTVTASTGFLLVNAFWLLPYLWGLPSNAPVIASAKINQMGSGEILARNQAFADLTNVLLLRGFSLDFDDLTSADTFGYMMAPWRRHLLTPLGETISWALAATALLGIIISLRRNKRQFWPFLVAFVFGLVMLGNQIPGVAFVSQWFYRLPFFAEAFRLPFTKFSLLFGVGYSLFLTLGLETLSALFSKFSRQALFISATLVIGAIFYLSLPAWSGNFLYSNLRLKLPSEYLDLFNFMQGKTLDERIAILPQPSFWSWKFYRWGFRGSGFLWYGLPRATLDRAFDPWSRENENYYWELSYALYSKNAKLIKDVFDKYGVSYALLDENLVAASHNRALFSEETRQLLAQIMEVKPVAQFGKLTLYKRGNEDSQSFISIKQGLPMISPAYDWTDNDVAYAQIGDYVADTSCHVSRVTCHVFPFRSLFTKRAVDEREFGVKETNDTIELSSLTMATSASILKPKALVYDSSQTQDLEATKVIQCGLLKAGTVYAENLDGALRFISRNQRGCLSFGVPHLSHQDGYLVAVESRHLSGRPLLFSLINQTAKHVEIETYLPTTSKLQTSYFILPPLAPDGVGYNVYLANDAIGQSETVNDIKSLKFYKLPYQELVSLRLPSERQVPLKGATFKGEYSNFSVIHPNPAFYKIVLPSNQVTNNQLTIILNQSFHPGWRAYDVSRVTCHVSPWICETLPMVFGQRLTNHVLVNNWANGWTLDELTTNNLQPTTIVLFFYPQLLEFLGLVLLPLPFIWFWLHRP
ncbi:MAG: hypothetical protein ACOY0S_03205 [Patescibacteria group bacterium]